MGGIRIIGSLQWCWISIGDFPSYNLRQGYKLGNWCKWHSQTQRPHFPLDRLACMLKFDRSVGSWSIRSCKIAHTIRFVIFSGPWLNNQEIDVCYSYAVHCATLFVPIYARSSSYIALKARQSWFWLWKLNSPAKPLSLELPLYPFWYHATIVRNFDVGSAYRSGSPRSFFWYVGSKNHCLERCWWWLTNDRTSFPVVACIALQRTLWMDWLTIIS